MRRLDAAVFLSGAALMGLEIVGSRILAPVFGTSIFVWGSLITVFLASLSLGYAIGGRLADRRPEPELLANLLLLSAVLLFVVFVRPAPLLAACAKAPIPDRFQSLLAATILFGAPSVLMGAVTPFAVRLAARDMAHVGSTAGRLSSVSTAGSILGTFLMAFYLVPSFETREILFGLGMVLVAAAGLVPNLVLGRMARLALVAGGAALTYLVVPSRALTPLPGGEVIYERETAYHHLRVVESGPRRYLYFNNLAQGYIPRREGEAFAGSYVDGLLLAWVIRGSMPRDQVVIGLGAGMLPTLVSRHAPEVATTTIELDPEVYRTAERFFHFRPGRKDRVILGDGRRELLRQVTSTDAIFEDAFFSDSVPFHLMTREFFELCRDRLSPDGVYAANFIGFLTGKDNALFWAVHRTLREVFPCVYVLSGELRAGKRPINGNVLLIASRSPDRLDRATVRQRAEVLGRQFGRAGIVEWADRLYDGEVRTDLPVLTDAYSPTEALQHLLK